VVIARQLDILIVLLLVFSYTIGDTVRLAASGAERVNARGGTVRPGTAGRVLAKREPGTGILGKTGTAVR